MILTPQYAQDGSYPASHLRVRESFLRTPGVLSSSSYVVTAASGLNVSVSAGAAYVAQTVNAEGSTFYNGLYTVLNDAPTSPYNTITAPLSNPRLDQVILRVYDVTEQAISGSSFARVEWLPGSENAGATYPNTAGVGAAALPANSLLLAYVWATVGEVSIAHVQNVVPLSGFGAWIPLTLSTNVGTYSGQYIPSARLEGDTVRLKGVPQNNTGSALAAGTTFATLPVGLRPTCSGGLIFVVEVGGSGIVLLFIAANGTMAIGIGGVPNGQGIFIDGIAFTVS